MLLYLHLYFSPKVRNAAGGAGFAAAGGGRSEVKRSRAGPPHGEPRTESPSEAAAGADGVIAEADAVWRSAFGEEGWGAAR
ncbi:MAG: hypothetical protein A2Z13_03030 [Deltaproteobacteria bacterium RBG_16_64_85]|nr:MAG: hypothetical protein A2Z13_03030 [Deltaproteobacteria bacterium RBG_16_64_85]